MSPKKRSDKETFLKLGFASVND